jgi:hypothetical protein
MAQTQDKLSAKFSASAITEALAGARSMPPDEFRRAEYAWLDGHNPVAYMAIQAMYRQFISDQRKGPTMAEPALQGALLGSAVLRHIADAGEVSYAKIAENHRNCWGRAAIIYAYEVSEDRLGEEFGAEAATAFMDIQSPVARTLCSVVASAGINSLPRRAGA